MSTPSTRPIVVTLDGSKNAENAIPYASAIAKASGSPVHFVHVLDDDAARAAGDMEKARDLFATYVDGLAKSGLDDGVSHTVATLRGSAAKTILEYAADARMIVIASHGLGGLKATIIGSVTDKVVRGTTVPVLMVPANEEKPLTPTTGTVLVALDGSEESEVGLAAGREFAKWFSAPVALVRSYTMPASVGVEFAYYPPDLLTQFEEAAKEYLATTATADEKTYLVNGPAAPSIEQAAEEVDAQVVVVASHGKGFAARIALGSTTDRLLHSLKRPLLVVPIPG